MLKKSLISLIILSIVGLSVYVGIYTHNSKENEVLFNGSQRGYRLHKPSGYNESQKYPLVVMLHGLGSNPRLTELNTGFSRKADEENFIVVYPYGTKPSRFSPLSWNAEFCCGYAYAQKTDDAAYINFLIDKIGSELSVDKERIYVAGYSNGGMLAHLVSLRYGEKIAASAIVSGAIGGQHEEEEELSFLQKTDKPVPTIIMHGRADESIPFNGGVTEGGLLYSYSSAYDSVNLWLENNKCSRHPSEILKSDFQTIEIYSDCEGAEVLFYALEGKHVWPGNTYDIMSRLRESKISATDVIWDFFSSHVN